jgi:DNA-binding LacI/PurR family transcriptional regulator
MPQDRLRYSRVMHLLRSRIACGRYADKLPGVRDLAKEFGVTPTTMQLALVQLEVLGIIRCVHRKGAFVVPIGEHPLDGDPIYARLTVPTPESGAMLSSSLMEYGFSQAARRRGMATTLEYASDAESAVGRILATSRAPRCVGSCVFIVPVETRGALRLSEGAGPIVAADQLLESPIIPFVTFDEYAAGRMLMQHLHELGHRRIGYVHAGVSSPIQDVRLRGAEEFAKSSGMSIVNVTTEVDREAEPVHACLSAADRPTGLICTYGHLAMVAMQAGAQLGLRVPKDLSVTMYAAAYLGQNPAITRVSMDYQAMGEKALEMLLDEALMAEARHIMLPVSLLDSGTTAVPPKQQTGR